MLTDEGRVDICSRLPDDARNSSKRPIIDEPNCERAPRQGATEPIRELQRCAPFECGSCRVPINLAHVWRRDGCYVGRPGIRNHSTVTVEAETQRYLSAGPCDILFGGNPACAQCGKHIADRIQVVRRMIGGILLGRRSRLVAFCPANNGQLQSLPNGVIDIR